MIKMYSEKVIDHFKHPRNMGKIENPNGIGKVGNPVCGDVMVIYLEENGDKQIIIKKLD